MRSKKVKMEPNKKTTWAIATTLTFELTTRTIEPKSIAVENQTKVGYFFLLKRRATVATTTKTITTATTTNSHGNSEALAKGS